MWVYSTSTATTAVSSQISYTASGSTFDSNSDSGTAAVGAGSNSQVTYETYVANQFETHYTSSSFLTEFASTVAGAVTLTTSYTQSMSFVSSSGLTRAYSSGSTNDTTNGTSSSTAEITNAPVTRAAYPWTTATGTTASALQTTTTQTTTATQYTTTDLHRTTSTTVSSTITTSTATTTAATVSDTFALIASTTLTAPELLVPISEAFPSEQAWQATVTDESAGYASHIGVTFTKRTGTIGTGSRAYNAEVSATVSSTVNRLTSVSAGSTNYTLSLTTLSTVTASDTYRPPLGGYPASVTATRSFTLLTTTLATFLADFTSSYTTSSSYSTSVLPWGVSVYRGMVTQSAAATINVSPTATITTTYHVTLSSSTGLVSVGGPPLYGSSASSTESNSNTATSTNTNTATTTHSTTDTNTTTRSTTTSATATSSSTTTGIFWFPSTEQINYENTSTSGTTFTETYTEASNTFTRNIGGGIIVTETSQIHGTRSSTYQQTESQNDSTYRTSFYTTVTVSWTISEVFQAGTTMSEEYSIWVTSYNGAGTIFPGGTGSSTDFVSLTTNSSSSETITTDAPTSTTTTTTTSTASTTRSTTSTHSTTEATTTAGTGGTVTDSFSSGSSFTKIKQISFTYPLLSPQTTLAAETTWTARAMHPRQGFRAPLSLATSDALFSNLSASPSSIYYPPRATQDDSNGAVTPELYTEARGYTTSSSMYTDQWISSISRMAWSSGLSSTFTTTVGTGATVTSTVTTNTATGTLSFVGDGPMSWFAPQASQNTNSATIVGGVPAKSEYGGAVFLPPGVRHTTRQTAGTASSSDTSWGTSVEVVTDTNFAHAFPTRSESVYSLTQRPTFYHSNGQSAGSTSNPFVTISLYPNL